MKLTPVIYRYKLILSLLVLLLFCLLVVKEVGGRWLSVMVVVDPVLCVSADVFMTCEKRRYPPKTRVCFNILCVC